MVEMKTTIGGFFISRKYEKVRALWPVVKKLTLQGKCNSQYVIRFSVFVRRMTTASLPTYDNALAENFSPNKNKTDSAAKSEVSLLLNLYNPISESLFVLSTQFEAARNISSFLFPSDPAEQRQQPGKYKRG